jgi:hypothetical protein
MKLLVGIGAQKAGTSWLADYLGLHEEVCMSPIKELHFFDEKHMPQHFAGLRRRRFELLQHKIASMNPTQYFSSKEKREQITTLVETLDFDRSTAAYTQFFRSRIGGRKLACEITPSYSMLDAAAFEDIQSSADEVKILFLLRNPIDRFWSALRMAESGGHVNAESDYESCLNSDSYVLRGDYRRTTLELLKVFKREDVHFEFYENLFSDEAIRRICQFCGIRFAEPDTGKEVNKTKVSKAIPDQVRYAAYQKFAHVYDWAAQEFGSALPESWQVDRREFGSRRVSSVFGSK